MGQLDHAPSANRQVHPKIVINTRVLKLVAAASIGPVLCLLFAFHYGENVPFEDDWSVVPMIHTALHGGIPFSALWQLHDQNRVLVPNVVFLVVGLWTSDNLRFIVILNALVLSGAFVVYLHCMRLYCKGSLSVLAVLVSSAIWFNLDGYFNILWAFQFAWFLCVLCLVAMIDVLLIRPPTWASVVIASVLAVVASFSSLQGLMLWPVGLVCLIWVRPRKPPSLAGGQRGRLAYWVVAAAGTAVGSLWGYSTAQVSAGSPVSFSVHHPLKVVIFVLEEIGEVAPNTKVATFWLNGLLGTFLLAISIVVIVWSLRLRSEHASCLPVALICFGLLMDVLVAIGRAELSWTVAVPQYSQPNLLILLAVVSFLFARRASRTEEQRATASPLAVGLAGLVVGLIVVLFGSWVIYTTANGIGKARNWDETRSTGARVVVNFDSVPSHARACYEFWGIYSDVLSEHTGINSVDIVVAKEDHLSIFAEGARNFYEKRGLPALPQCGTIGSP